MTHESNEKEVASCVCVSIHSTQPKMNEQDQMSQLSGLNRLFGNERNETRQQSISVRSARMSNKTYKRVEPEPDTPYLDQKTPETKEQKSKAQ